MKDRFKQVTFFFFFLRKTDYQGGSRVQAPNHIPEASTVASFNGEKKHKETALESHPIFM